MMRPARRRRWSVFSAGILALGGATTLMFGLHQPSPSSAQPTQLKAGNFNPDTTVLQTLPARHLSRAASHQASEPSPAARSLHRDAWNGQGSLQWALTSSGTLSVSPWGAVWWGKAGEPPTRLDFDLPGFDPSAAHWHDGQRWVAIARPHGGLWLMEQPGPAADTLRLQELDLPTQFTGRVHRLSMLSSTGGLRQLQLDGNTPEGHPWQHQLDWPPMPPTSRPPLQPG